MALDKKCILFNGGKTIELSTASVSGNEGLKLTKNEDGTWQLNLNAVISKDEAEKVIFKFEELNAKLNDGDVFEEVFPNMAFYSALDDNGNSKFVPLQARSQITPQFNREIDGFITIKMNLKTFGKTQNPKTQNAGPV